MKISYLNCDNKKKLFSFRRHDYKAEEILVDGYWKYFMIDGGFDYNRYSGGTLEEGEIKDLIEDIRKQFVWGKNYDENNNRLPATEYSLLQDLTSSHICGILSYFTNKIYERTNRNEDKVSVVDKTWCITHEIFIQELNYRIRKSII